MSVGQTLLTRELVWLNVEGWQFGDNFEGGIPTDYWFILGEFSPINVKIMDNTNIYINNNYIALSIIGP